MPDSPSISDSAASSAVQSWEQAGSRLAVGKHEVFVRDVPAALDGERDPLLVLHGFPSCSFDFRHVLEALRADRRVLLFDFLGFGLSSKPDERYGLRLHADVAEAVVGAAGIERVALLTHDMGDSVGGELLARDLDGNLSFEVGERVLTNGSIYIEMAHLTAGQQLLLSLPDERFEIPEDTGDNFRQGLGSTFSASHPASAEELDAQWELLTREGGNTLLARTIRYIEDRRAEERRFTGAIERHPSRLGVVWGELDPVAIMPMTEVLSSARPDLTLQILAGVGHYPMIEAPEQFAAAVRTLLG